MKKINVIIVGGGAYVSGRNTDGFGTILPAILEGIRENIIDKVHIVSKHSSSHSQIKRKISKMQKLTGIKIDFEFYPKNGTDDLAYQKLIQQKHDNTIVIVATPDYLHYDVTKTALNEGKHVLVVKPFTLTVKEANSLIKLAKTKHLFGVVDFHKRYDFTNLKIQEIMKKKKIGDVQYIHVEYSQKKAIPEIVFKSWAEKTNIFQYLGVHYVDIIHFVTNAKPTRVLAVGHKKYLIKNGVKTYDSITAIIEWKNKDQKFTSTILCNWIDPNSSSATSYQQIKLIGSNGRIESDQKNRGLQVITDQEGIEDINPYFNQTYLMKNHSCFKGYGIDSIIQFLKDCRDIFEGNVEIESLNYTRPSFSNSLISVMVTEAVNKSLLNNGKWIYIKS